MSTDWNFMLRVFVYDKQNFTYFRGSNVVKVRNGRKFRAVARLPDFERIAKDERSRSGRWFYVAGFDVLREVQMIELV